MKMTVTDITEGMNSSHEGYAELVADSVSFSLGRALTHEENEHIYNIIQRAVSDAVSKLESCETETEICRWVIPPFLTEVISRIRSCVEYAASA